jgi:hypothetical protein
MRTWRNSKLLMTLHPPTPFLVTVLLQAPTQHLQRKVDEGVNRHLHSLCPANLNLFVLREGGRKAMRRQVQRRRRRCF